MEDERICTIAGRIGAKPLPSDLAVCTFRRILRSILQSTSTFRDDVLRLHRPEIKPHSPDNAFFLLTPPVENLAEKGCRPSFLPPRPPAPPKEGCIWGKQGCNFRCPFERGWEQVVAPFRFNSKIDALASSTCDASACRGVAGARARTG